PPPRPRDPALIAKWIKYRVISTERQDWRRGVEAAYRYRRREEHLDVPYEHVEPQGAFPLGRWLSDQRRAYRAGQMTGEHAAELEELGIVWDTADAAFAENLAAARAYYELHGTLAAPRHATALDKAVGQWLTNIRRPGGLGKDQSRARRRAQELADVDPDWNPRETGWTVDWQRHYAYLAQLLAAGARLDDVVPGVTRHGEDVGRWLSTQRKGWERLNGEQQRRLGELGVKPQKAVRARKTPAKTAAASGPGTGSGAFQKGLEALAQYIEREGRLPGRGVVQVLPDGTEHRTGTCIGNQKAAATSSTPDSAQPSPNSASTGPADPSSWPRKSTYVARPPSAALQARHAAYTRNDTHLHRVNVTPSSTSPARHPATSGNPVAGQGKFRGAYQPAGCRSRDCSAGPLPVPPPPRRWLPAYFVAFDVRRPPR
ncbi:Helicase associated domain protein, partial [Streptomyces sp. NPDC058621]|uniref:helicase associated domain-containing protein n=1 Tax=Streptomyces sp. NPDC058621 TaxID=3346561 RepID=UPI00364A32EC